MYRQSDGGSSRLCVKCERRSPKQSQIRHNLLIVLILCAWESVSVTFYSQARHEPLYRLIQLIQMPDETMVSAVHRNKRRILV